MLFHQLLFYTLMLYIKILIKVFNFHSLKLSYSYSYLIRFNNYKNMKHSIDFLNKENSQNFRENISIILMFLAYLNFIKMVHFLLIDLNIKLNLKQVLLHLFKYLKH